MIFAAILGALIAQASPTPACAEPNREATVIAAVAPVPPPSLKAHATAIVVLAIGPSGNLVSATIYQSSGVPLADRAAIQAAKASTFSPKFVNCVPVVGLYVFRAEFDPDGTPLPTETPRPVLSPRHNIP